jgi:DNA-binding LytR/AlgR family response regulator
MSTVIKIAIIEDEESAVKRLLRELARLEGIDFAVQCTVASVIDAVDWLKSNNQVDLIFMDIQLSDGISFEIFKQVDMPCPVIFTTAYDEYALQAFKVNSLDYLLKPVDPVELRSAMDRYFASSDHFAREAYINQLKAFAGEFKTKTYRSSFLVHFKQKMMLINTNEVAYLYIKHRCVFLKKKDGDQYVVEFFLDELEKQLNPSMFYRANRQFLVARSSIVEIEPYFTGRLLLIVKPEPPTPIIISKEKSGDFKRWADY